MKAPLLLVGSQAGYDIKGEVTKQAAADLGEMLSKDTWTNDDESDLPFG